MELFPLASFPSESRSSTFIISHIMFFRRIRSVPTVAVSVRLLSSYRVESTRMAKFISKTLQFGGCRLPQATLLLNQNVQVHGRTFTTLSSDSQWQCYFEMKQRFLNRNQSRDGLSSSHPYLVHTCTSLYSAEGVRESGSLTTENLIGAWFHEASPFGTVRVLNVPFDVHILPLNPMDYPELNKSIVKLFYNNGGSTPVAGHKLSEMGKLSNTKVCVEEGRLDVSCDIPQGVQLPLVCVVTVPLKFDVELYNTGGGNAMIKGMESDNVSVHLKQGDCHLTNLKTGSVTVRCDDGNITSSKQLLGTISLYCGKDGSIRGDRLQGVSLDCTTESGDIDIKTVYADQSSCHSQTGNIHIRDCHGKMTVRSDHGNLTVDSVDGKLSAELGSGSADVYITRQDGVFIQSQKGDITLRFSEDGACSLDLDAAVIEPEDCLPTDLNDQGKGFLRSETEHTVKASTPQGKISLKKQDWLSAIKLQFGNTTS